MRRFGKWRERRRQSIELSASLAEAIGDLSVGVIGAYLFGYKADEGELKRQLQEMTLEKLDALGGVIALPRGKSRKATYINSLMGELRERRKERLLLLSRSERQLRSDFKIGAGSVQSGMIQEALKLYDFLEQYASEPERVVLDREAFIEELIKSHVITDPEAKSLGQSSAGRIDIKDSAAKEVEEIRSALERPPSEHASENEEQATGVDMSKDELTDAKLAAQEERLERKFADRMHSVTSEVAAVRHELSVAVADIKSSIVHSELAWKSTLSEFKADILGEIGPLSTKDNVRGWSMTVSGIVVGAALAMGGIAIAVMIGLNQVSANGVQAGSEIGVQAERIRQLESNQTELTSVLREVNGELQRLREERGGEEEVPPPQSQSDLDPQ